MRRVTLLKQVKKRCEDAIKYNDNIYLCGTIAEVLDDYCRECYFSWLDTRKDRLEIIFPKFNKEEAKLFTDIPNEFWEDAYAWFWSMESRLNFVNHLIEIYKDDKTDIGRIINKLVKNT